MQAVSSRSLPQPAAMSHDLLRRIERFLRDPASARFDDLARDAFSFQVERIPALAALAAARGVSPESIQGWRDVPAVPALAFKSVDLSVHRDQAQSGAGIETFRSSGTTGRARSVHRHPFPDLYRAVIDASFPRYCWPGRFPEEGVPILSLVPPRQVLPDSSLAFMVDHVARRWGSAAETAFAFGTGGLDGEATARWVERRERDGRPGLVLATAFALVTWLDEIEAAGGRLYLPPGTVLFETGGFKGRTREVRRSDLLRRVEERLGVPPERVVREYGMTELTSQLYTDVLAGGDPDVFVPPHWVRIRVLDPETLLEVEAQAEPGAPGLIAVFDLANLSSTVHLLTEDLGALVRAAGASPEKPAGLRLLGRAAGAELRGCSLTAEEMGAASSSGGSGDAG